MSNSSKKLNNMDNILIDLIRISKQLTKLLKKENELLQSFTYKSISGLQVEKAELMKLFEKRKATLLKYKKEESLNKDLLVKLQNANNLLQDLMTENKQKLSSSLDINYKISELIKDILIKNTNRQAIYDENGCYNNKIFEISPISFVEKNSI